MMTAFLRIKASKNKQMELLGACQDIRFSRTNTNIFHVKNDAFNEIPGSPFAYWSSESLRENFRKNPPFEHGDRCARVGLQTSDDFRFVRSWWESCGGTEKKKWYSFVRGGSADKFFGNLKLQVNWDNDGAELKAWASKVNNGQHWSRNIRSPDFYMRPGITWPLRAAELSPYPMPVDCIFSTRGTVAFEQQSNLADLLGLMGSRAFDYLFKLLLGRFGYPEFSIGAIQRVPVPNVINSGLGELAHRGWSLKRSLDTVEETSHAFLLPAALRYRLCAYDPPSIEAELESIQSAIDEIAFDLYGFSEADRQAALGGEVQADGDSVEADEYENESEEGEAPPTDALLSWAVGVVFGRFDWRLAIGQRQVPPEPDPFEPLPAKSPGMLPDCDTSFHNHAGVLVDDQSSSHDLPRLIEQVLDTVSAPVDEDIRRWLQKNFFSFHFKRYSKSRRKAPIYWPLATASGSYTLWLYSPRLNDQTLFTAVNDFVDPKLEDVRKDLENLRGKGASRSKQEEGYLEALSGLEHELADLRDSLLEIAPNYRPNHDDGVQISAAPLWKLFSYKPWQKVLKDTWAKLEKGEYDWSYLAMNYWPDRVREKCITDKSLAIAHNLEHLYIEPEPKPAKARGRAKKQDA